MESAFAQHPMSVNMNSVVIDYDPKTDTQCVISHGADYVVPGINDDPHRRALMTIVHPDAEPGATTPLLRLYGIANTDEELDTFVTATQRHVPELSFSAVRVCAPFLVAAKVEHRHDAAALNARLDRYTDALSARTAAVKEQERMAMDDSPEGLKQWEHHWYRQYQTAIIRKATTCTVQDREEARQQKAAAAEPASQPRSTSKRSRRKKRRRKRELLKQERERPVNIAGISDTLPIHRRAADPHPDHTVAVVAILLDDSQRRDDNGEHLVVVLETFPTQEDLTQWCHKNHKHLRRFHLYDVPLWEYFSPEERVNATNVDRKCMHNSTLQEMLDGANIHSGASDGGSVWNDTKTKAEAGGNEYAAAGAMDRFMSRAD